MRNLKCWHVLAFFGSLALIASVLFPVFAQAHAYSGPGMGTDRIASEIDRFHHEHGRWPTRFEDIRPRLNRRNVWRGYTVSFLALETRPDSADYVVTVNGNMGRFRTMGGGLKLVPDDVVTGVLPAK